MNRVHFHNIADEAGVSVRTLYRVMNNQGAVSSATRPRWMRAVTFAVFADIKIASYCFYCTTMYCNVQYDRRKRKARFVPLRRMCYTVLKDTVENEVQI